MSPESSRGQEGPRTLFRSASTEKLVSLGEKSSRIKVIDTLHKIVEERYILDPTIENQMALERYNYLQERILEVSFMDLDVHIPDTEELWLTEEINIALFKPIGE